MNIRNVCETDYHNIIPVLNEWWGGRQMANMLQKLFFVHFQNTSFVAEEKDGVIGFLVGFVSQSQPGEAYIHFAGVHPDHRKEGVAL
ncbi:MAG TPA: GNAT family N-acetyltransferase, partial [Bacillales bacterium]|nr:GNAT family N-acetyltransferase [Bacillales bacterium]